jgi:hypothetical protein
METLAKRAYQLCNFATINHTLDQRSLSLSLSLSLCVCICTRVRVAKRMMTRLFFFKNNREQAVAMMRFFFPIMHYNLRGIDSLTKNFSSSRPVHTRTRTHTNGFEEKKSTSEMGAAKSSMASAMATSVSSTAHMSSFSQSLSTTVVSDGSRAYSSTVVITPVPRPRCARRVLSAADKNGRVNALLPTTIVSHVYSFLGDLSHCAMTGVCRHFFRCSSLSTSSPYEMVMPLPPPTRGRFGTHQCQCADASFPGVTIHWKPASVRFRTALGSVVVARWLADNERLRHLVLVLDTTKVAFRHSWTLPSTLTELKLSDAFDENEAARVVATCRHSLRRITLSRITVARVDSFLVELRLCTRLTSVTFDDVRVRDVLTSAPFVTSSNAAPLSIPLKLTDLVAINTVTPLVAALVVECADSLHTLRCVGVAWTPLQFQTSVARCRALRAFEFISTQPPASLFAELPPTLALIRVHALYDVTQNVLSRLPNLAELHCATIGDKPCLYDQKRVFVNVRRLRFITVSDSTDNYDSCCVYLTTVLPHISSLVVPRSLSALTFVVALCRSRLPIATVIFAGPKNTTSHRLSDRMIQLSLDRFPYLSCETCSDILL